MPSCVNHSQVLQFFSHIVVADTPVFIRIEPEPREKKDMANNRHRSHRHTLAIPPSKAQLPPASNSDTTNKKVVAFSDDEASKQNLDKQRVPDIKLNPSSDLSDTDIEV